MQLTPYSFAGLDYVLIPGRVVDLELPLAARSACELTFDLRILRVLGGDGGVLFDVAVGHDDERVEELIDEVGVEYLDLLLDLSGDDFMGHREIGV